MLLHVCKHVLPTISKCASGYKKNAEQSESGIDVCCYSCCFCSVWFRVTRQQIVLIVALFPPLLRDRLESDHQLFSAPIGNVIRQYKMVILCKNWLVFPQYCANVCTM